MDSNTWRWAGVSVAAGVVVAAALCGCESAPAGGDAAAVHPDVTDVRPPAVAAAPAVGGPVVYDMSGMIPTAPQPLTEPAATPAAAPLPPSPVRFAEATDTMPVARPLEPANVTPPPPAPAARTHVVRRGETLFAIARAEYGTGKQWRRLAAANPTAAAGDLRVGQRLVVP